MASTFHIFRKHQKAIFAVLCIVAMVGFVIGDAIGRRAGNSRGGRPEAVAVATWNYGTITNEDLSNFRMNRNRLEDLIRVLMKDVYDIDKADNPLNDDELLVEMQLAKKGEQLGIVVSNQAVQAYFRARLDKQELVNNLSQTARRDFQHALKVLNSLDETIRRQGEAATQQQMRDALAKVRMSPEQLFAIVRTRILASRVDRLAGMGSGADTPAERFEQFVRVRKHINGEAMPVRVSEFYDLVPDPKEEVLKKFYDDHKNAVARDGEPGFRQPRKIAFQYVKADYDAMVAKAEAEVTDEAIEKYYKEKKEDFRDRKLPPMKEDASSEKTEKGSPGDSGKSEKSAPDAKSAPEAEPAKNDGAGKAAEPPKDNEKAPAKSDDAKKSGALAPSAAEATQFVALNADEPVKGDAGKSDAGKGDASKAAGSDAPGSDPTKSATEPPKADGAATADPMKKDGEAPKTDGAGMTPEGKPPAEEPKYLPLDQVKSVIRQRMAVETVKVLIPVGINRLKEEVNKYGKELETWKSRHAAHPKEVEPAAPNLASKARENGLVWYPELHYFSHETVAKLTDLGRTEMEGMSFGMADWAFNVPSLAAYSAHESGDTHKNRYLFWKVDETPETLPEYSQIRGEVLYAYKMVEARKLAKAEGERLFAAAKKDAAKPLAESLAEDARSRKIVELKDVSWKREKLAPGVVETAAIVGIDEAGDEFFKPLYELREGEVGLLWNKPKTAAYVVRAEKFDPSMNVLVRQFLAIGKDMQRDEIAEDRQRELVRKSFEAIQMELGFHREKNAQTSGPEPVYDGGED